MTSKMTQTAWLGADVSSCKVTMEGRLARHVQILRQHLETLTLPASTPVDTTSLPCARAQAPVLVAHAMQGHSVLSNAAVPVLCLAEPVSRCCHRVPPGSTTSEGAASATLSPRCHPDTQSTTASEKRSRILNGLQACRGPVSWDDEQALKEDLALLRASAVCTWVQSNGLHCRWHRSTQHVPTAAAGVHASHHRGTTARCAWPLELKVKCRWNLPLYMLRYAPPGWVFACSVRPSRRVVESQARPEFLRSPHAILQIDTQAGTAVRA
jgi:hypothetical protein